VTGELSTLLRFALRSFVIPALVLVCVLLSIGNVVGAAQSVRADYAQVEHTRAEYAANHLDFEAALRQPMKATTTGNEQVVGNLARYDFDAMAAAVASISPSKTVPESLKFFGFLVYPALFFLLGLWLATGQRRYKLDKVALVRAGPNRTALTRQFSLAAIAAATVAATLLTDVVARSIAQAALARAVPLSLFTSSASGVPLPASDPGDPLAQWGVILLVTIFFGMGGLAIGTVSGVFGAPAIVFLVWDFVVPVVGVLDPRDWFEVLGHRVFDYSAQFELAAPIPLDPRLAIAAAVVGSAVFVALGYVGIRIRNPRAT
jgi:hypothetical protein